MLTSKRLYHLGKAPLEIGSVVIGLLAMTLGAPAVKANHYKVGWAWSSSSRVANHYKYEDTTKPIHSKDYQETTGLYLMVNITGVDNTNHTIVSPHYQDIRLEYGKTYTTNEMIKLVQDVIDPSAESFKVISLKNAKLTKASTAEILSTDHFTTPIKGQYHQKDQTYILTGQVLVEKVSKVALKDIKVTDKAGNPIQDSDAVAVTQHVKFLKKDNGQLVNVDVTDSLGKEGLTGLRYYGSRVSSEELFEAAKKAFETTQAFKDGYQLVKRISTTVTQDLNIANGASERMVYHADRDEDFNYIIDANRIAQAYSPSYDVTDPLTYASHQDIVTETYFISKDINDDYSTTYRPVTIYQQDKQQQLINEYTFKTHEAITTETIDKYLKHHTGLLDTFQAKNGTTYQFTGSLTPISETEFIAVYKDLQK
ncbi:TPA: kinase [Streptococcus equi subsp. zooepidemicus]|uniref:kinase n=1 Tax=Streptococcus equi TaxID=1336 RepID=UPI0012AF409A|nr:kinase [Streptococcus equi]HEL1016487.1 kinase [Streptococcus equi subsp. ruminatorum]MCD3383475.1 kinase [Streptococcus equi subsp. zooepidemicus]MCD3412934.1 kinase [Streptococcus equi subsp. zooepidemicus]MCD3419399.1 kinase [Streptococcus equi subsp. zooepidemicus]MCD3424671.1 kinase [Streptococcus equi subsp. zooepidemicus]